jgi:oligopeptide/dipeptide ABC transporter ATP-binding protein
MYAGRLLEDTAVATALIGASHPYTRGLLLSVPKFPSVSSRLYVLEGELSSLSVGAPGCCFAPRCPVRIGVRCDTERPTVIRSPTGSLAACHLLSDDAFEEGVDDASPNTAIESVEDGVTR